MEQKTAPFKCFRIPRNGFSPLFKLTAPEHIWPRSVIVKESSNLLKYDGKDIEAEVSMGWNEKTLQIQAKVRDRLHIQRYLANNLWKDDNMQFAICCDLRKVVFNSLKHFYNASAALQDGRPQFFRYHLKSGNDRFVSVERNGLYTMYKVDLPWNELGVIKPEQGMIFAMNFCFFDNNDPAAPAARHWLALTSGLAGGCDPFKFALFQLD